MAVPPEATIRVPTVVVGKGGTCEGGSLEKGRGRRGGGRFDLPPKTGYFLVNLFSRFSRHFYVTYLSSGRIGKESP